MGLDRVRPSLLAACLLLGAAGCGDGTAGRDTLPLAARGVFAGALSPGSELAVVGSLDHGGSLWRVDEHARLFDWNHRPDAHSALVAAAFSPDGTRAVTTEARTLVVWDTRSGAALASWAAPGRVHDVALAADGRRVLMGLADHSAVVFDAESGAHLHTLLHRGPVGGVALAADGRWALTGSDDGTAVLWNLRSGERVHTFHHDNPVRQVALSSRGRYAFTASQRQRVTLWDGASGERLHLLARSNRGVTSARFSPDERHLLLGYVDAAVELWDVPAGRRLERWRLAAARRHWGTGATATVAVGFSQAPRRLYALGGDGRLRVLRRAGTRPRK